MLERESNAEPYTITKLFYAFREIALNVLRHSGSEFKDLKESSLRPFLILAPHIARETDVLTV